MNRYHQILKRLYEINATKAMKLGIENMLRIDTLLRYPSKSFPSIHVAGTNGKGSVTAKIAKGLEAKYQKVGLYSSPHISTFRERIMINRQMIPEEDVVTHLEEIFAVAERSGVHPTLFEYTTLLAFKYFSSMNVDVAVFETGLGGRLDATNIIEPKLSVITSIDFDHTDILGKTLMEIAQEKGGIIKPGIPVVLGPTAKIVPIKKGCQVIQVNGKFPATETENRAIARAALEFLDVPENAIKKGITTQLPCRRERVMYERKEVILDVAHNPIGLLRLFEELDLPRQSLRVVCGLSKTKDLEKCLRVIEQRCQSIHLVKGANHRSASTEVLRNILLKQGVSSDRVKVHASIAEGIERAAKEAATAHQQVVMCGTFFIMGEVREALGIQEPRDPCELNELKV